LGFPAGLAITEVANAAIETEISVDVFIFAGYGLKMV